MPRSRDVKTLIAPLALYRQILRAHRFMPPTMRAMGDDYVKAEFRRHKDIDNPAHIVGFIGEWQSYLDTVKDQISAKPFSAEHDTVLQSLTLSTDGWGRKLDSQLLDKMSDEQLGQLYELRNELKKTTS